MHGTREPSDAARLWTFKGISRARYSGPMNLLKDVLRAGHAGPVPVRGSLHRVLVAGGAGALGSAVVEHLLAARAFAQVGVLVTQPLGAAMRGLATVDASALLLAVPPALPEDTAVIVFDRERHANGREQAFLRPKPEDLSGLAASLRRRGVRHLLVVMPHAPASLPDALKQGLANLDEHAVAALGFDHLVFVRSAQTPASLKSGRFMQGVADWVLAQLQLMVPQRDKPVRPAKVAQFVAALAAALPDSRPGTRVVPPEIVWEAAQHRDASPVARDWLLDRDLRPATVKPARM